jgi:hypothetical protein
MQSFVVHAFGPPSEVLAPPLSGSVPPSSPPLDDGDAAGPSPRVASPDGTPESSEARGLAPPLPLPLPPPDVEHATHASFSEAC